MPVRREAPCAPHRACCGLGPSDVRTRWPASSHVLILESGRIKCFYRRNTNFSLTARVFCLIADAIQKRPRKLKLGWATLSRLLLLWRRTHAASSVVLITG